jgi:hypothetical protein
VASAVASADAPLAGAGRPEPNSVEPQQDPIAFYFLFRDPIAFYFLFRDLIAFFRYQIAFTFLSRDLCVKKFETGYQTTSLSSLFQSTRATKHVKKSHLSLAKVSLYEAR